MWGEWFVLVAGGFMVVEGAGYLTGRRTAGYGRPRLGGLAAVTGGLGLCGSAVVAMAGGFEAAGWIPICLVFAGLVLFCCSGPVTRFSRRRCRG